MLARFAPSRYACGMSGHSHRFTHAICRRPGASVTHGLRAVDTGDPDPARLLGQHDAYVAALRLAGLQVTVLPALDDFPDALFVEDTALCLPQGAVVMRPGAPSRLGEAARMAPHLGPYYADLRHIRGDGATIEGGDILMAETEILVGLSARTNVAGVAELAGLVADWGWRLRRVETPPGVLHFKTDCALLDGETILSTRRLAASGCFAGYRVIEVPEGEEAAANLVRVNDHVLMAAGFPRTAARLDAAGYRVLALDNSECARLDGGMSCLSLRFAPLGAQ